MTQQADLGARRLRWMKGYRKPWTCYPGPFRRILLAMTDRTAPRLQGRRPCPNRCATLGTVRPCISYGPDTTTRHMRAHFSYEYEKTLKSVSPPLFTQGWLLSATQPIQCSLFVPGLLPELTKMCIGIKREVQTISTKCLILCRLLLSPLQRKEL